MKFKLKRKPSLRNLLWKIPLTVTEYRMLGLLLIGSLFFSMPGRWCAAQFEIAATVDGQPVNVKRLQLQVGLVLKKTPAEGLKLKIIQAQVLEENIKQRLVFIYLQGSQHKASQAEIDAQSSNLETELIEQKSNLKQYLQKRDISEAQLRDSLAWDICWSKYLATYLTDQNLKKYFDQHRRKFDGTQLRVAHVLFQPEDEADPKSWKTAFAKATSVLADLQNEKIDFEQAVIQYSSGATKINHGELGWITWRGPMAPEFTIASFKLKTGEFSQPVQTSFGFHLINLLEEKPGKIKMEDIRPQVVQGVKRYLFDWLATKQAKQTKVEFTGNYPFFFFFTKTLCKSAE